MFTTTQQRTLCMLLLSFIQLVTREKKLIRELISSVSAIRRKLDIIKRERDIKNWKFIHFPTKLECKKNFEIYSRLLLSFLSDLDEEFGVKFKDFLENRKLPWFLKHHFIKVFLWQNGLKQQRRSKDFQILHFKWKLMICKKIFHYLTV